MLERADELVHELRSPMTAILAHVEALLEGFSGRPEEAERLSAIRAQTRHLLRLLGRDHVPTANERLAPLALAEEAVRLFAGAARAKRLALTCGADGPLPGWADFDATTVRLVLANLVGNALKFTNEGGVRIGVTQDEGGLRWSVGDTGIGMDAAQLAQLGQPYVQVHSSSAARGGQGLGLATARRLAERARGRIDIDSLVGQGTTVRLTIPIAASGAAVATQPHAGMLCEALLVGLGDTARLAIGAGLKAAGVSVSIATDGAAAAVRCSAGHRLGRGYAAVFIADELADGTLLADLASAAPGSRLVLVGGAARSGYPSIPITPDTAELRAAMGT